jgi:hypothetical protein
VEWERSAREVFGGTSEISQVQDADISQHNPHVMTEIAFGAWESYAKIIVTLLVS